MTHVNIQLADSSVRYLKGEAEDVLIKTGDFVFPVDFVVLGTTPPARTTTKTPVILGRPFLATSNSLINCRNGVMQISFGIMIVQVNIFDAGSQPHDIDNDLGEVSYIHELVDNFMPHRF